MTPSPASLKLPDGWKIVGHPAGWIAQHTSGAQTLPFPDAADASVAAALLEEQATDPQLATATEAHRRLAAAKANTAPTAKRGSPVGIPAADATDPHWLRLPNRDLAHYWPDEAATGGHYRALCGQAATKRPRDRHLGRACPVCAAARTTLAAVQPGSSPTPQTFERPAHVFEEHEVDVPTVVPCRWQARTTFDETELQQLADSIKQHGILNRPLVFVNERGAFELLAGERRWRAAKLAGLQRMPVRVLAGSAADLQAIAAIDNLQRTDLSDVEQGREFERIIAELGISENELSKRLGKNRAYIQQRRAIANASPEVQQALNAKEITISQARGIAQTAPNAPELQKEALAKVKQSARYGNVTEDEARKVTTRIVSNAHKKALHKLGWKIDDGGEYSSQPPIVWSRYDRPRAWTGAEILQAVREERKPALRDIDASGALAEADKHLLTAWHGMMAVVAAKYAPWIAYQPGRKTEYLTAAEAHAKAEEMRATMATAALRAKEHGWELTMVNSHWKLTKRGRETLVVHQWKQVEEYLARIAGGWQGDSKEDVERREIEQAARYNQLCACGKAGKYRYTDNGVLYQCEACEKAEAAAKHAHMQALAAYFTGEAWIDQIPLDVLRRLGANLRESPALGFDQYARPDAKIKAATKATPEQLRAMFVEILTANAWTCRDTPFAVALSKAEQAKEAGA